MALSLMSRCGHNYIPYIWGGGGGGLGAVIEVRQIYRFGFIGRQFGLIGMQGAGYSSCRDGGVFSPLWRSSMVSESRFSCGQNSGGRIWH